MSDPSESRVFEMHEPNGTRVVVLEDDGRTGYAYLYDGDEIVGDVWLYNSVQPISPPKWDDPNELPFQNREELYVDDPSLRLREETNAECRWQPDSVEVLLDGRRVARLVAGEKPGASILVRVDGPLARRLS